MHRLTVALLAAFDALIAAAVGVVAVAAPLTVLWATTLGATGWSGLWPTAVHIWQFGHHVPVTVTLPPEMLVASGIDGEAASFVLSLAPLGFFAFTAWIGARSGMRAARAGAWLTGVISGGFVMAMVATAVEMTSSTALVSSPATLAVLLPTAAYVVPALIGAVVRAFIDGDGGIIDALRDIIDRWPTAWAETVGLTVRGIGAVLAGLVAVSGTALLASVIAGGPEIVALYQASGVDGVGATMIALATLAYLPTLLMWALAWVAGPGITVGAGSSVSPAASHVGVLPGLPPLGVVPEFSSTWLLAVVLVPVGIGFIAGWMVRARYAAVLGEHEPWAPRVVMIGTIAAGSAGIAAVAMVLASGSLGPGRMSTFGPHVGLVTAALFVEVAVGAAVMLLAPRTERDDLAGWSDGADDEPARAIISLDELEAFERGSADGDEAPADAPADGPASGSTDMLSAAAPANEQTTAVIDENETAVIDDDATSGAGGGQ